MSAYKKAINPSYAFRFSAEEIKQAYSDGEDAFRAGDFLLAAQIAEQGGQVHGCALLMSGLIEQGMAILDEQQALTPISLICRAYGFWLLGRNAEALDVLGSINNDANEGEQAGKLRDLISATDIPVFVTSTMLPVVTAYEKAALKASSRCGQFIVKHVASPLRDNAYDLDEAGQALNELIDTLPPPEKPRLVFALTPQWVVPQGFEKVSVPKVLWCHDSDHFLYQAFDNFRLYDMTIVNNSQEHFELTKALDIDCVSNIMLSPLCSPFPVPTQSTRKDIDVFVSGATLSSTHPDKGKFIYLLSELQKNENLVVVVVDGHISERDYFSLLSRSKCSPLINRYLGCPSPRWRDTLSASTCLLYPEGSLYGQMSKAAYPYRPGSITDDISRHLQIYNENNRVDLLQQECFESTKRDFAIYTEPWDKNLELLLKYAAFTVLVWRKQLKGTRPNIRRRAVWLTPHLDSHMFGEQNVCSKIEQYAENTAAELGAESDEKDFSNAAKLYVQLASMSSNSKQAAAWRARADAIVERGFKQYPQSLLLRFNRAYWTFFERSPAPANAASMFKSIITDIDGLEFDPLGSDIGLGVIMDGTDQVFSYVEYGREIVSFAVCSKAPQLDNGSRTLESPKNFILSLCHAYIGWAMLQRGKHNDALQRFRKALAIYRNNEILLKTTLRSLHACLVGRTRLEDDEINELIGIFFDCVEASPSVLLTDTHRVIPILHRVGRFAEIKYILEKWYQLGNIIYLPDGDPRAEPQIETIKSLLAYSEFFPGKLQNKIYAWRERGGPFDREDLSQFEEILYLAFSGHSNLKGAMHRFMGLLQQVYSRHIRRRVPLYAYNWLRKRWLKVGTRIGRLSSPLRNRRFTK